MFPDGKEATENLGLESGYLSKNTASFAISNVWLANRVTPLGDIVNHVIVTIAQKRGVRFDVERSPDGKHHVSIQRDGFFVPDKDHNPIGDHIIFNGGCTLVFDLEKEKLRYVIKKDMDDEARMIRQFKYEQGMLGGQTETYLHSKTMSGLAGPFAFMHSCSDHES